MKGCALAMKSAVRQQSQWGGLVARPTPARNKTPPVPSPPSKLQTPYGRYLDAKVVRLETGKFSPDVVEEMQRAFLDALRSKSLLPDEMQVELAFAFEQVCAGIESELLTPIKRPGGREPPIAKHLQSDAIRYLRWCADGRISDTSPTKTVADAYSVDTRTIRGWLTAWKDKPTPVIFEDYGAKQVAAFMKASGKQYKRFLPRAAHRRIVR